MCPCLPGKHMVIIPAPLLPARVHGAAESMHRMTTTESRPEAMADVPGICELPLTRAVVQYRRAHELYRPGGRIQDIGLAVVLEGRFASSVRAIDLGSARIKYLNLASELVVLDWVYGPTLAHLRTLTAADEDPDAARESESAGKRESAGHRDDRNLRRYCFDLALRVLNRRGFSPLTRPTLLRIGFRDICKDLDLHENTVVRIVTGRGTVTRVHLDYEANALVFRTATREGAQTLEGVLREVFPDLPVGRPSVGAPDRTESRQVRFGIPVDFNELRGSLQRMRGGLSHLIARFEPERFRAVGGIVSTFGERATLSRLSFGESDAVGGGLAVH